MGIRAGKGSGELDRRTVQRRVPGAVGEARPGLLADVEIDVPCPAEPRRELVVDAPVGGAQAGTDPQVPRRPAPLAPPPPRPPPGAAAPHAPAGRRPRDAHPRPPPRAPRP